MTEPKTQAPNGFTVARFEAQKETNERLDRDINECFERLRKLETEGFGAMTEIRSMAESLKEIQNEVKKITDWKNTIIGGLIVANGLIFAILVPIAIKIWGK